MGRKCAFFPKMDVGVLSESVGGALHPELQAVCVDGALHPQCTMGHCIHTSWAFFSPSTLLSFLTMDAIDEPFTVAFHFGELSFWIKASDQIESGQRYGPCLSVCLGVGCTWAWLKDVGTEKAVPAALWGLSGVSVCHGLGTNWVTEPGAKHTETWARSAGSWLWHSGAQTPSHHWHTEVLRSPSSKFPPCPLVSVAVRPSATLGCNLANADSFSSFVTLCKPHRRWASCLGDERWRGMGAGGPASWWHRLCSPFSLSGFPSPSLSLLNGLCLP